MTPDARRKRVARALVEHTIEHARANGVVRIDLTANDQKREARALYLSLGFERRDTANFRLKLQD